MSHHKMTQMGIVYPLTTNSPLRLTSSSSQSIVSGRSAKTNISPFLSLEVLLESLVGNFGFGSQVLHGWAESHLTGDRLMMRWRAMFVFDNDGEENLGTL